jgi:hypothetical protein
MNACAHFFYISLIFMARTKMTSKLSWIEYFTICEREIGAVWTIEMVLEACLKRDERSVLLYQLGCGREDEPAKREGSTQQSRPYTTRMEEADQCEFI